LQAGHFISVSRCFLPVYTFVFLFPKNMLDLLLLEPIYIIIFLIYAKYDITKYKSAKKLSKSVIKCNANNQSINHIAIINNSLT